MANLIFRTTDSELQIPGTSLVKNAPLTNAEIDGNFISLKKFVTQFDASNITQGTLPSGRINDTSHGTRGGGTQHSAVTTTVNGFMIAADKVKLNGIAASANNYSHPTGGADTTVVAANGLVLSSITINSLGHVTAVGNKSLVAADIPNLDISKITTGTLAPARFNDTSHGTRGGGTQHSAVTTTVNGFMIAADKVKLNGIAASANNYSHPTGGANTTIIESAGLVISAVTVNSLGHVTSISSKTLGVADIPTDISITGNASTATTATNCSRSITAGDGLSGGGALTANRTVTLGTPGTITNSSTNGVTATSHTHAVSLSAADVGAAATSHGHAGSDITSGTFDVARIPNLDAGKITTGTLGTARIPTNISITGNAASASVAATLTTSTSTSTTYFNLLWHSGTTIYNANSKLTFQPSTGALRSTNNITAYYSDKRLKDFTGTITNALNKVCQLNGYYFRENTTAKEFGYTNDNLQVGVSAQEVEDVLPEIVTAAPFDIAVDEDGNEYSKSGENYKTIYYDKLVPLLIEAIKELKREIELIKGDK